MQANTSTYGDSRITAPYKTEFKNILQVKGGETDVVMIATLDITELVDKRSSYSLDISNVASICYSCKRPYVKTGYYKNCDICKNMLEKSRVKGTPPNFL